ncbi:MAG: mandelate racemase family protein [Rhodospirillales bacterium]|nr:mandelate racemase family protein [Rhodospirillales bacterium]
MKIVDIKVRNFLTTSRQVKDSDGHSHPGERHKVRQSLLSIVADDGSEGHCFAPPEVVRPHLINGFVRTVLIGEDPLARERLWQGLAHWQRGSTDQLTDRTLAAVELALWDLAGRRFGMPVYQMIGSYRDRVLAYGSTMCGDEMAGGLATPEDYARYAEWLVARGYKAIKLHTWMKPVSFAPDPRMDVKACAAVREAVGADFPLMLDAYHGYSRTDALWLGREIQKLGYAWYEEPMDEFSMSSYAWLAANLDIPVIGPESAHGKFHVRAEWVKAGACDILRTGVHDVGGIGPSLKIIHLAESFGMNCEVHGGGAGNLTLCAVQKNGRWYERGLLHPFLDYDQVPDHLNSIPDPMDEDGYVHLSTAPGLGEDINFDYINANLV